jgi:hypothetical protein
MSITLMSELPITVQCSVDTTFSILASIVLRDIKIGITNSFVLVYALFTLYILLCVLKYNTKSIKMTLPMLRGLFLKNPIFVNLFCVSILVLSSIIPSALLINNLEILKGIYIFDKTGSYIVIVYLFAHLLLILASLNIIKILYSKKEIDKGYIVLEKRTTCSYVVLVLIISFLICGVFL